MVAALLLCWQRRLRPSFAPQPDKGSGCGKNATRRASSSFRSGVCYCHPFPKRLHHRGDLLGASGFKKNRLGGSSGMLSNAGTKSGHFASQSNMEWRRKPTRQLRTPLPYHRLCEQGIARHSVQLGPYHGHGISPFHGSPHDSLSSLP